MTDVAAAVAFVATHGRLLDRRRLDLLLGQGGPEGVLAALAAYRNAGGGYGWGLEPDLRSRGSQPIEALHAFEVFEECGPAAGDAPVELCDWLAGVTRDDGGLPFVLPIDDPAGCAPWFAGGDRDVSSLHGTAAVAGAAQRVARSHPGVAAHPWLAGATRYCLDGAAAGGGSAYERLFVLRLLDALAGADGEAAALLERLAASLPPSGVVPVEGGVEGEALRPLDFAPEPGTPLRAALPAAAVEADLDRLAGRQQPDGGWEVDFASSSPAAALEWRGVATVRAIAVLTANGRLG